MDDNVLVTTEELEEKEPHVSEPSEEFFQRIENRLPLDVRVPRIPTPIPFPIRLGARFGIWKQDPTVGVLGYRIRYIPGYFRIGPRDARIDTSMAGTTPVHSNAAGDFVFRPRTRESDCAHTFAIVRMTLNMFQQFLGVRNLPWAWNRRGVTDGITVYPHAGVGANAYYSRNGRQLNFLYFRPNGSRRTVYTCRSADIVAHETGHAILDGLKPGWLGMGNTPQTAGLHESFGDLSAIFLALRQFDQVEAVIAMTRANLHDKSFLPALAEQFGQALGRPAGLRNADNDLKLSEVSNEVHSISRVFTGAIYDILADIFAFERRLQIRTKQATAVLYEVSQRLCKLYMQAIMAAPPRGAVYADVVNEMLTISESQGDSGIYRYFIRRRFAEREVIVTNSAMKASLSQPVDFGNPEFANGGDKTKVEATDHVSAQMDYPQDRCHCCGTMQQPEFVLGDTDRLAKGEAIPDDELDANEIEELKKDFA